MSKRSYLLAVVLGASIGLLMLARWQTSVSSDAENEDGVVWLETLPYRRFEFADLQAGKWRTVASENTSGLLAFKAQAIQLLENQEYLLINSEQYRTFTGRDLLNQPSMAYLVRGVSYGQSQRCLVYQSADSLLVWHLSLGSAAENASKNPVVVLLPSPPQHVFGKCSMAQ